MSDETGTGSETSAEKAYAEAAGLMPVDFPPKAKRVRKAAAPTADEPETKETETVAEVTPLEEVLAVEPETAVEPQPAVEPEGVAAPVFAAPVAKAPAPMAVAPAKPKAKPAPKAKPVAARKVSKPKTAKPAKAAKPAAPAKVAAAKRKSVTPKAASKPAATPKSPIVTLKDKIMTAKTTDFTAPLKSAVADVQKQAKVAYDKTTAVFGEYSEFTKGNVDAIVESGKILAAGLQDLGKDYVAEGKTAFQTLTADVKQLAAVKSPAEFFKLQGDLLRRNLDTAIAQGSKNSEAVMKLASQAFAPISGRVTLAVEKVKKAA